MDTPWNPRTTAPSDTRTVLTCHDVDGIPQCLSFALYDAEKKQWTDLLEEEPEFVQGLDYENDVPQFDYWMDIPPLPKTE